MNDTNSTPSHPNKPGGNDPEGYPLYPPSEDIYSKFEKEEDLDPEDPSTLKTPNEKDPDANNEKDFSDDVSGGDLDIPGSELDDEQEEIGSEDEENNAYSMGQG
jgi:hypothetical protein